MDIREYGFDPSYNYSLEQLLAVKTPKEPRDFDSFWHKRYQNALKITPNPQTRIISENNQGWRVFEISYTSTDNFPIRGWLLLPNTGVIKRGLIIGHGYGSCGDPDFRLPFTDTALLFPSFRGLGLSAQPNISSEPLWHVLHDINQRDRYILGGCVEDIWLSVSALLQLFPRLAGHLGYLGISFSGGIGALALAWEQRIARGHLNLPAFGHHPLRLRLPTRGSTSGLQQFYQTHKKQTLKTLRYYDAALAAKRITMPIHCACAVFDPFVAPPAQFAIYNALTTCKQLFVLKAGHHQYPEQKQQEQTLLGELNAFFAPLND
jgi:cephalosporin-C deacetylase